MCYLLSLAEIFVDFLLGAYLQYFVFKSGFFIRMRILYKGRFSLVSGALLGYGLILSLRWLR